MIVVDPLGGLYAPLVIRRCMCTGQIHVDTHFGMLIGEADLGGGRNVHVHVVYG